ncbi:hypothetical protein [Persicitalea sp.]|uniref:hypothetical protein n=1 Tax=Persicitalea sp. TaxID=3100273 RepID=UPI003593AEED
MKIRLFASNNGEEQHLGTIDTQRTPPPVSVGLSHTAGLLCCRGTHVVFEATDLMKD